MGFHECFTRVIGTFNECFTNITRKEYMKVFTRVTMRFYECYNEGFIMVKLGYHKGFTVVLGGFTSVS